MMPDRFEIALFRGCKDNRPTHRTTTWPRVVGTLAPERPRVVGTKHDAPGWAPARFDPARRARANVVRVYMLVLDYDETHTIEQARETWAPWAHVLHTSWSHAPDAHRFRVAVPLAEPPPGHAWGRFYRWADERTDGAIDGQCKDPSRLWFLPAVSGPDHPWEAHVHAGPPLDLDWRSLPAPEEEQRIRRKTAPRKPVRYPPGTPEWKVRRAVQERLKTDAAARQRAAEWLGARVMGAPPRERADRVECPQCARPSVWFWMTPDKAVGAYCDHENSCGWFGFLDELLEAHGADWRGAA